MSEIKTTEKGNNIVLIGLSGSGKTTIGKELSILLKRPFIDTDELLEEVIGSSVLAYFKAYGEEEFRKLENQLLETLNPDDGAVIATGGGMPCYGDNMDSMLKLGTVIYLSVSIENISDRILKDVAKRPLYREMPLQAVKQKTEALLAQRESDYLKADSILDANLDAEQVIKVLLQSLKD